MTNQAHVFQHNRTGVQIFVYHEINIIDAKLKFSNIVIDSKDWSYLGMKYSTTII